MTIGTNCPDCSHPTVMHPMSAYSSAEFPVATACAICLLDDARRVVQALLDEAHGS
jgi:hypothetical protein